VESIIPLKANNNYDFGTSTRIAVAFGTMEAVSGGENEQPMVGGQIVTPLGTALFEPRS
jgi:hypothetical protein